MLAPVKYHQASTAPHAIPRKGGADDVSAARARGSIRNIQRMQAVDIARPFVLEGVHIKSAGSQIDDGRARYPHLGHEVSVIAEPPSELQRWRCARRAKIRLP